MASKTVIRHFVDGTTQEFTRPKQGRKSNPAELVKVPITSFVLPVTKMKLQERARSLGMSLSAYVEMAALLYEVREFSS